MLCRWSRLAAATGREISVNTPSAGARHRNASTINQQTTNKPIYMANSTYACLCSKAPRICAMTRDSLKETIQTAYRQPGPHNAWWVANKIIMLLPRQVTTQVHSTTLQPMRTAAPADVQAWQRKSNLCGCIDHPDVLVSSCFGIASCASAPVAAVAAALLGACLDESPLACRDSTCGSTRRTTETVGRSMSTAVSRGCRGACAHRHILQQPQVSKHKHVNNQKSALRLQEAVHIVVQNSVYIESIIGQPATKVQQRLTHKPQTDMLKCNR
ncbi:hypothetical protein COO60DRAFT_1518055, partial [Scenedesmus sp. NREL 46B-D3]